MEGFEERLDQPRFGIVFGGLLRLLFRFFLSTRPKKKKKQKNNRVHRVVQYKDGKTVCLEWLQASSAGPVSRLPSLYSRNLLLISCPHSLLLSPASNS